MSPNIRDFFNKKKGFLGLFLLPTNIFSTIALLFLTLYSSYIFLKMIFESLFKFNAIGFNIFSMFVFPDLSRLFYGFNIFSIIGILMLLFSLIIIFYSIKTSKLKLDIRKNYVDYLSYLIIYSVIMSLFWIDSIIYKLFFRNKDEGWKYG